MNTPIPPILIICPNRHQQRAWRVCLEQTMVRPEGVYIVTSFEHLERRRAQFSIPACLVRCVNDFASFQSEHVSLRQRLADWNWDRVPILVETRDDNPSGALDALAMGAEYVDCRMTRSPNYLNRLLAGLGKHMSQELNSLRLPPWSQDPPRRFFVSMSFDLNTAFEIAYRKAIKPTLMRLGIEAHREDEGAVTRDDIGVKTKKLIESSDGLLMDLSYPTLNTMFEAGYADGRDKHIIYLCRTTEMDVSPESRKCSKCGALRDKQSPPALIRNIQRVTYETNIELSFRLYFGLGGTLEKLRVTKT